VPAALLIPNDYNPNVQPPPEFRLLKVSLLEDGWTQPIVAHERTDRPAGTPLVIVDGEHRWRVAREDREVAARTGGRVPIVRIRGDRAHLMMATIRHNRARGEHGVKAMSLIVRELLVSGMSDDDVSFLLQMEPEEVDRLADAAGLPRRVVKDAGEAFANGWVPK
jgi:ParB-like chromosome segregation protein Spo0J